MFTQFSVGFPIVYFGMTSFLMINCNNHKKLIAKPFWCLFLDLAISKLIVQRIIEYDDRKKDFFKYFYDNFRISDIKNNYDNLEDEFVSLFR